MKSVDEMCEIMQASKTKEIEYMARVGAALNYPEWRFFNSAIMHFNWADYDYRVKAQEPRRVWVNTFASGGMCAFKEKYIAGGFQNASDFLRCDEFIELTPEIRERLGL